MSKIKKTKDYVVGAIKNPELFMYYAKKFFKHHKLGYSDELLYWKKFMKDRSLSYSQDMQHKEIVFALSEIKNDFNVAGKDVKCLEIGPGARSRLTYGYDNRLFDLVAVDPLADDFIKEFGGREFLKIGRGEDLTDLFAKDSFHLVYASNAIDHGDDPAQTFEEIDVVLKDKGILIVCGDEHAADSNRWLGLHQHNLWICGDDLCWQNKNMKSSGKFEIVIDSKKYECIKKVFANVESMNWFFGMWKK